MENRVDRVLGISKRNRYGEFSLWETFPGIPINDGNRYYTDSLEDVVHTLLFRKEQLEGQGVAVEISDDKSTQWALRKLKERP